METERLFYESAYTKEFTATVLSCVPKEMGYAVILDRTAFYPEGGGQPCDLGTLGWARVLDVQEQDGRIVHLCDTPLEGEVQGRIDWDRRFDLMQQHSGEHLLSGLVHRRYGFDNVGFHMGADVITIDFSGIVPQGDLPELEREVNNWIWRDAATEILWPCEAELETLHYRSKKALEAPVRIVRFPGMDDCACCGTHVARTGEIGLLKILSCVKFHQGVRLELVCGERAFAWLSCMFDQNREISGLLSAKPMETAAAVRRMQEELAFTRFELTGWRDKYFSTQGDIVCGEAKDKAAIVCFEPGLKPSEVQHFCLVLMEKTTQICAVFSGDDENGYKYAIGQRDRDLRSLIKDFNAKCGGRGGGRPHFAQGSAQADRAALTAFFEAL